MAFEKLKDKAKDLWLDMWDGISYLRKTGKEKKVLNKLTNAENAAKQNWTTLQAKADRAIFFRRARQRKADKAFAAYQNAHDLAADARKSYADLTQVDSNGKKIGFEKYAQERNDNRILASRDAANAVENAKSGGYAGRNLSENFYKNKILNPDGKTRIPEMDDKGKVKTDGKGKTIYKEVSNLDYIASLIKNEPELFLTLPKETLIDAKTKKACVTAFGEGMKEQGLKPDAKFFDPGSGREISARELLDVAGAFSRNIGREDARDKAAAAAATKAANASRNAYTSSVDEATRGF